MISFRGLGNGSRQVPKPVCTQFGGVRNRITDSNGTFHVNVMRRSERIQPLARKPIEIYFNGLFGERDANGERKRVATTLTNDYLTAIQICLFEMKTFGGRM